MGLTAEGDDAHGVEFVLWADVGAHADDEDVAEAGGGGDDPDEDPQNNVGQQVLEGRDAVSVGLAAAHMRSVAAVLEFLKVAVITDWKTEKGLCSFAVKIICSRVECPYTILCGITVRELSSFSMTLIQSTHPIQQQNGIIKESLRSWRNPTRGQNWMFL